MKFPIVASSVALALACGAGILGSAQCAPRPDAAALRQPLAFSHAKHADDLACTDCHAGATKSPYAGIANVKACLLCHAEAQGDSPEEPKVRAFAEERGGIPWVRVNRLPGHVYFSHEAHVTYAQMSCEACHGDMASRTEPIAESQIDELTMRRCMACHAERGASNDCLTCHK
jgi:hypothetical protein